MPVVEISAPSYSILKYTNNDTNRQHAVRLYFDAVPTYDSGDNVWQFETYTDGAHVGGWTLEQIWEQVFERMNSIFASALGQSSIDEVQVWQAEAGVNTFLGYDTDDYTGVGVGGAAVAASYVMAVFKTSDRSEFKLTMMDAADARPQRYTQPSVPAVDDSSIGWFMTKSAVKFVNYQNERLVIAATYNTGYNRKLARSYGRQIAP